MKIKIQITFILKIINYFFLFILLPRFILYSIFIATLPFLFILDPSLMNFIARILIIFLFNHPEIHHILIFELLKYSNKSKV